MLKRMKQLLKATDEFKTNTQDIEHDNNSDNAGMLFMRGEEANRYTPDCLNGLNPYILTQEINSHLLILWHWVMTVYLF
jgi:hypothetical protein